MCTCGSDFIFYVNRLLASFSVEKNRNNKKTCSDQPDFWGQHRPSPAITRRERLPLFPQALRFYELSPSQLVRWRNEQLSPSPKKPPSSSKLTTYIISEIVFLGRRTKIYGRPGAHLSAMTHGRAAASRHGQITGKHSPERQTDSSWLSGRARGSELVLSFFYLCGRAVESARWDGKCYCSY